MALEKQASDKRKENYFCRRIPYHFFGYGGFLCYLSVVSFDA